jgi:pseudouridine synthase
MADRLQKILASAGFGSRRHNEELIRAGRVRVNGVVAALGDTANPATDRIEVDGRRVSLEEPVYIMLHKPRNVLSSTEDELDQNRTTIRDLVDIPGHLFPIGRLDKNSLGLILLTNDGQLAHRLTHPRYEHPKEYRVKVEGHPDAEVLRQWRNGIQLDDRMTAPAYVRIERRLEDSTWLRIVLREGRKRQIRRVAAQLGHPVQALIRTKLGPLSLGDLPLGKWRHLTEAEVRALRKTTEGRNRRRPSGRGGKEQAGRSKRRPRKRSE